MSKILVLGDIHGLTSWKGIVQAEEWDVCVFLGDYFDSWDHTAEEQIENFRDIWAFKMATEFEDEDRKVILLMGNHDLHYLIPSEEYSGYNRIHMKEIQDALLKAKSEMQAAYELDGYLFTHAGVTKTWARDNGIDTDNIVEGINALNLEKFKFSQVDTSGYGQHVSQGPMWVRPESLEKDAVDIYIQVVGHTKQKEVENIGKFIVLNDVLWNNQYVVIESGKVTVKTQ